MSQTLGKTRLFCSDVAQDTALATKRVGCLWTYCGRAAHTSSLHILPPCTPWTFLLCCSLRHATFLAVGSIADAPHVEKVCLCYDGSCVCPAHGNISTRAVCVFLVAFCFQFVGLQCSLKPNMHTDVTVSCQVAEICWIRFLGAVSAKAFSASRAVPTNTKQIVT